MLRVYKAPEVSSSKKSRFSIFLAGTIEMGKSVDWQTKLTSELMDYDIDVYNPRRESWDNSWKQTISNRPFSEQVNWELDHIDLCDVIVFVIQGNSKSPISLMELGYVAKSGKQVLVQCDMDFWRRGNVEIICDRNNIPLFSDYSEFKKELHKILKK